MLEEDANEIQAMIEKLNEEVPDSVAAITREIDEKFAEASNYFLDAIEDYLDFMENEDKVLLEQASRSIKQGAINLEEADAKAQTLYNLPSGKLDG